MPVEGMRAEDRIGRLAHEVPVCLLTDSVVDVRQRALDAGGCAVVNDHEIVLGWLSREALQKDAGSGVEEAMEPGPSTFRPSVPLEEMRDYMRPRKMKRALVTSSDGRLIGTVELSEIENAIEQSQTGSQKRRYV